MKIIKLAIILCVLLLASCEKEIEFKGEQTDPKLVINSIVEPRKPVTAAISRSYFFLDTPNTTAPDDLTAMLFVNGNCIGNMTRQTDTAWNNWEEYDEEGNLYQSYKLVTSFINNYQPAVGDIVKITTAANGFDDAAGETSPLPLTLEWSLDSYKTTSWDADYYIDEEDTLWTLMASFELTLSLHDRNANQSDYYRLLARFGNYDELESDLRCYVTPTYDDPLFSSVVAENDFFDLDLDTAPEGVFTDVLFDGKTYQIKLPIHINANFRNRPNNGVFPMPIVMQHLSKEYYYYLNTYEQPEEIMQFFAEPIQTYTNVNGGYGIVGGRTVDTLWFDLPLVR